ncbi:aminotransferase class I/II-fold pyridoxal phosphate-dependent enzyme, partial [Shewanella xiamenensis]|uniref:aminotransferase class I/II-fold pyridoxal phosphate-dependent enzyme n=2 Tax=Shewanella TaxID=22 RepID=UPI0035B8C112
AHPELRQNLQRNISIFKQLCQDADIPLLGSETAIQPLIIGDAEQTLLVSQKLKAMGIWVGAIRPPTVPIGSARLRITLSACHSEAAIRRCVNGIAQVLTEVALPRVSERPAR